jgi:hypothetical protein
MPLSATTGRFKCAGCGAEHGYLPETPPRGGLDDNLFGELICTGCGGVGKADTEDSFSDRERGNRHTKVSKADAAAAREFYGDAWIDPDEGTAPAKKPAAAAVAPSA